MVPTPVISALHAAALSGTIGTQKHRIVCRTEAPDKIHLEKQGKLMNLQPNQAIAVTRSTVGARAAAGAEQSIFPIPFPYEDDVVAGAEQSIFPIPFPYEDDHATGAEQSIFPIPFPYEGDV